MQTLDTFAIQRLVHPRIELYTIVLLLYDYIQIRIIYVQMFPMELRIYKCFLVPHSQVVGATIGTGMPTPVSLLYCTVLYCIPL